MILFLRDWYKYPNARPDWETPNQSFLDLAKVYQSMGIKNYFFHLALHNPELKGIDPFDPMLTDEQMSLIAVEAKVNPWYFFREILKIKPQASANPIQFRASRGNIGMYWAFFNHIDLILIQPRQTGKSVGTDALSIYLLFVATENTRINMLTKDENLRRQQVERLKAMRDYLPPYMNHHNPREDYDNTFMISCKLFNNEYSTAVPRNNEDAANNIGRGSTAPISFIDEPPFIPFIDVIVPAMLAATTAAVEEAKKFGTNYGNIFTTTAGKKDTRSGKFIHEMLQNAMVFDERKLFDCDDSRSAQELVKNNTPDGGCIMNMTLSHRQLGYTDAWLRDAIIRSKATGEAAERDFLNRWTSGGLSSPLSTELNNLLRQSEMEPLFVERTKRNYAINWYLPYERIHEFMMYNDCTIGLDTSEGIGRDSMAFVMIDNRTLRVVATLNVSETNVVNFAEFIAEFLVKYPKVTVIPERKSTGVTIIDMLLIKLPMLGEDPFKRIFNTVIDEGHHIEKDEFKCLFSSIDTRARGHADKYKKRFGFATAGDGRFSRNGLYDGTLVRAAKLTNQHMYDKRLIDEVTGLVVKNDRIDHKTSGHDDMVIAWMLAAWMLLNGRNLSMYGINAPLRDAVEYTEGYDSIPEVSGYDKYINSQQSFYRDQIVSLGEELAKCQDDILAQRMEQRLQALYGKLSEADNNLPTFDSLVKAANEKRRNKIQMRHMGVASVPGNPNYQNLASVRNGIPSYRVA